MALAESLKTGTRRARAGNGAITQCFGLILLLLAGLMPFAATPASAQEMRMQCDIETVAELREVLCDFKLSENIALEELTFTADGQTLEGAEFTPYSGLGKTSAFLFLVDVSNPARANTVRRNLEIVKDQMRFSSATRLVGLATFANNLEVVYNVQDSHSGVDATLDAIVANGAATEFFSSALEGIKVLGAVQADRRALVIMSDGKAEDTAYNRNDVVSAAAEAGVTIIGLGFAERESETPALQEIRRLSEETGGYFNSVVANAPFEDGFLRNLPRYIENGGVIKAPLNDSINGAVEFSLIANTSTGNTLPAVQTIEIEALPAAVEEEAEVVEEPGLIEKLYKPLDSVFAGVSQWAAKNPALAILLPVLPLLAIAAIVFVLSRGTKSSVEDETFPVDLIDEETVSETELLSGIETIDDPEDDGATRAMMTNEQSPNGYFEIVGSEANKYSIDGHAVSIGRHSDNDIRLSNDSVHRHHAHLSVSANGVATIHDLDTANGVIVNGAKIDKKVLAVGDIVEFGEVRLRFVK